MELRGVWSLDRDTNTVLDTVEATSPSEAETRPIEVCLAAASSRSEGLANSTAMPSDVDRVSVTETASGARSGGPGVSNLTSSILANAPFMSNQIEAQRPIRGADDEHPLPYNQFSDAVYPDEDQGLTETPPPEFAEAYDNPQQSMPTPLPPVTFLPAPANDYSPFDMLAPPAPHSVNDATGVQVEHSYMQGMYKMSRTAYKSILTQFASKDMSIKYFLEVEIEPKPGPVKESFHKIQGRVEVSVLKGSRT